MKSQLAQLRVQNVTQDSVDEERMAELVTLINKNVKPLKKVSADDVYIRVMYIVSDEVNSYGGMFGQEEMDQLTSLLIDSPVLVGHRKDKLPIARNFYSEIEINDSCRWVKSYFYWLKNAEGADTLLNNIDGGLYKECSIGFTFNFPQCTICSDDIRRCPHEPFTEYKAGRTKQTCFYYYKEIDKVLETSLVYRGAVPDTSISDNLFNGSIHVAASYTDADALAHQIEPFKRYLITPFYDGVDVLITKDVHETKLSILDNKVIDKSKILEKLKVIPFHLENQNAIIVGYRGKERCTKNELNSYLSNDKSRVTRIEIKLFPNERLLKYKKIIDSTHGLSILNAQVIKGDQIEMIKSSLMTKDGVRIYPLDLKLQIADISNGIYLTDENDYILSVTAPDKILLKLVRYKGQAIDSCQRFLAEPIQENVKLTTSQYVNLGVVQKIRINNQDKYLIRIKQ